MLSWKRNCRKPIYALCFVIFLLYFLLATELGVKSLASLGTMLLPGHFSLEEIEGNLLEGIKISKLKWLREHYTLTIKEVTLSFRLPSLYGGTLKINDFFLQEATLTFKNENLKSLFLSLAKGRLEYGFLRDKLAVKLTALQGEYLGFPLQGMGAFKRTARELNFEPSLFALGPYTLEITPTTTTAKKQIDWKLSAVPGTPYEVNLSGFFIAQSNVPFQFIGEIVAGNFTGTFTEKWTLSESVKITVSPSKLLLPAIKLINPKKAKATAHFSFEKETGMETNLDIPVLPLSHSKMSGSASLNIDIIKKPKEPPKGRLTLSLHPGQIFIPVSNTREYKMPFKGGIFSASFTDQKLNSNFAFTTSSKNSLQGTLNFNQYQKEKTFIEQEISGDFKGKIEDLNILHTLFPDIARLQATILLAGTFSGTLKNPQCHLTLKSPETAFFLPKYNIKVRNLRLAADGNLGSDFTLNGAGKLGEGTFNLKGTFNPLHREDKNQLEITGKNLQLSNTEKAYIIANPKLSLQLIENILYVDGEIIVPEAKLNLQDTMTEIRVSNDVKIIGSQSQKEQIRTFKWVPNLYLRLEKNIHFKGYGLEGIISGKIQVEERLDGLLTGLGRLTIKEGKYRLQGSTRYIHRGRLLFPPGTLLNDPILDIRISERSIADLQTQHDLGIYVQGTLQKPIYQLYSSAPLQQSEILSKLGLSKPQPDGTEETSRLVSQTAYFLAGGASPLIEKLQSGFKLDEFGLTTRTSQKRLSAPGSADTALIVGKALSKKLYLQYLQSIMEPNSTVRLKYSLSPRFTASIESSSEENLGVDIIYSVEKN
jgi:hypothetical protein